MHLLLILDLFYFYLFISSWEFPVTKTNDRKIKISKVKKKSFFSENMLYMKHVRLTEKRC